MRRDDRGFTMIEVVMALFLLGLLFFVMPLPGTFSAVKKQDATIGMIAADLRWARMNAILQNRRYQVKVFRDGYGDSSEQELIIFFMEGEEEMMAIRSSIPKEYTLYRNLNPRLMEEEFHWTTFTPQGSAGTGTLGLMNEEGRLVKIIISNMGRVRIEKE